VRARVLSFAHARPTRRALASSGRRTIEAIRAIQDDPEDPRGDLGTALRRTTDHRALDRSLEKLSPTPLARRMFPLLAASAATLAAAAAAVPQAHVLLTGYLPWANFTVNPAGAQSAAGVRSAGRCCA
jgi:hypothetical protein